MKNIFLLDTMSFVYRAYHAAARSPIQMTTRAGFPTGATFIFCNMLRKLKADHSPEFMVALLDTPGETFRDALSPEYKANRKGETPGDLVRQLPYIFQAIESYNIPKMELPGYEADDLIGTLATKAYADPDNIVYIVTGDKDMYQLVNDRTFTVNPMKDLTCDAAKVELIVGVPPQQVIDVMALRGDTVDNIPGAPGIGKKGSVDLIKQFGTLEEAMSRTAEIKRKSYRESIEQNAEQIKLSKRLVTIECAAPVELDLPAMQFKEPNKDALSALYTELEFASLLKKEALAAIVDFAEIVAPPEQMELGTQMSDADTDAALDAIM